MSRVVTVSEITDTGITLVGVTEGSTWLEVAQSEHRWTAFKVKVLPLQAKSEDKAEELKTKTLAQTMGAGPNTAASDPAATPAISPAAPSLLLDAPLQISIEPTFGVDTERFPSSSGSLTINSSFQELATSLRYRAAPFDTFSLRLPYIRRQDKVRVENESQEARSDGLGDIQIGYERLIPRLNGSPWDATLGAGIGLPTGKSIYRLESDGPPLGSGHYELSSFLDLRRVADPVILNAQIGLNYSLPRQVNGQRINPGLGYSFQTGIGYAIDDRFVLSEQLSFSRRSNVFLLTPIDSRFEKISQAYLTQSLFYKPTSGTRTFRLAFTLGLNNASTDYIVGLTVNK